MRDSGVSSRTNRHGVVWWGAGAATAAATARRTAAGSTGSSVNSRIVRRAKTTSAEPYRNMSWAAGRMRARAPGPSSGVTRWASPRTTATGTPESLPLTSSPAEASSSASAVTVAVSSLPYPSVRPRRSSRGRTPATPIARSVSPFRHGLPKVSEMTTPTSRPSRSRIPRRIRRAEPSGSSGSSRTVPGAELEASTPAAAMTKPCRVSAITVVPRRATTRAASSLIASVRSAARRIRPSALLTILEVTTRMSPSARSGTARAMRPAMSSPGRTSGSPGTPVTVIPVTPTPALCRRRGRPPSSPGATGRGRARPRRCPAPPRGRS